MADTASSTLGYGPLARMQEKAAQLKQELEVLGKGERHAQFKRSMTLVPGAGGASGGGTDARRFSRVGGLTSASLATTGLASGYSLGGAASRMSSRRASNASGTDFSDNELSRAGSRSPSRRGHGRGASGPRGAAVRELQESYQAAIARQNQLEETVAELEVRARDLSEDNERRQESYMRREAEMQAQVEQLQDALRVARGEAPKHPVFGKVTTNMRELHAQVVSQIEGLLEAQAAALRSEEHGTLRRFAARLGELESQVAAERAQPSKEEGEWMERSMALRKELDATQEIAQVLDKKYALLADENGRLRSQFKLQEEDREYLIKQTVALKKENAALRNQLGAVLQEAAAMTQERDELLDSLGGAAGAGLGPLGALSGLSTSGGGGGPTARPMSAAPRMMGAAAGGVAGGADGAVAVKIKRYEDVIESLKRLLEAERRRTKQARAAHTAELAARTELQALLRQCVEDVRERRRAMEADGAREQQYADRAVARARPVSARPPATASVSRPLSATPLAAPRRPASAANSRSPHFGGRPPSGRTAAAMSAAAVYAAAAAATTTPTRTSFTGLHEPPLEPQGSAGSAGHSPAAGGGSGTAVHDGGPLSPRSREALVESLLAREELLKLLFDRAFPGVAPHPPSDPFLDRMAAWQEQRDAQVAANAKVLAAARAGAMPPAAAARDATPGGPLLKEAAAKPWVLNVDAMLSEFLAGREARAGAGPRGGEGGGG